MPVLKNPRHERFAQELAKGKTATEAYETAGFRRHDGNCSRLRGNERIEARLAELQDRGAKRAEVTLESLLNEVEEARKGAMHAGQFSAAVAALKEKGILSGKRIERAEVGGPGDFERLSDDELDRFIASRAGRAGLGSPGAGISGHQGGARSKPH